MFYTYVRILFFLWHFPYRIDARCCWLGVISQPYFDPLRLFRFIFVKTKTSKTYPWKWLVLPNFKDTRLACVNWTKRQTLTQDHDQTLKNVNFVWTRSKCILFLGMFLKRRILIYSWPSLRVDWPWPTLTRFDQALI